MAGVCIDTEWRAVEGYPNYCVSKDGEVLNQKRGVLLTPYEEPHGYFQVTLSHGGSSKKFRLHRLVAQCFLERVEGKEHVNHKNGDKSDNSVNNLEWCSPKENQTHAIETGLSNNKGQNNGMSKLTDSEVAAIRKLSSTFTQKELANEFGVSRTCITRILNGTRRAS